MWAPSLAGSCSSLFESLCMPSAVAIGQGRMTLDSTLLTDCTQYLSDSTSACSVEGVFVADICDLRLGVGAVAVGGACTSLAECAAFPDGGQPTCELPNPLVCGGTCTAPPTAGLGEPCFPSDACPSGQVCPVCADPNYCGESTYFFDGGHSQPVCEGYAADGAGCQNGALRCVTGDYCAAGAMGSVCAPLLPAGTRCPPSSTACQAGYYCGLTDAGAQGVCLASLPVGSPCSFAPGECVSGSNCESGGGSHTNSSCSPGSGVVGYPCTANTMCSNTDGGPGECDIANGGLVGACAASPPTPPFQVGSPCDGGPGSYCDGSLGSGFTTNGYFACVNGVCTAPVGVGGNCAGQACQIGLYCNAQHICAVEYQLGQGPCVPAESSSCIESYCSASTSKCVAHLAAGAVCDPMQQQCSDSSTTQSLRDGGSLTSDAKCEPPGDGGPSICYPTCEPGGCASTGGSDALALLVMLGLNRRRRRNLNAHTGPSRQYSRHCRTRTRC